MNLGRLGRNRNSFWQSKKVYIFERELTKEYLRHDRTLD